MAQQDREYAAQRTGTKNLILFCEGTEGFSDPPSPRNVPRMYTCLDLSVSARRQTAFYHHGPGRAPIGFGGLRIEQALGNVLGLGSGRRCLAFYRFLCEHYEPGDQINFIGFSRGAYIVRTVADIVSRYGIVDPENARVNGGFEQITKAIFRHYASKMRFREAFDPQVETAFSKYLYPGWDVDINFVGLWDTVGAMGGPDDLITSRRLRQLLPWVYPDFGRDYVLHKIRRVAHALAIDDDRKSFSPVLWDQPPHGQTSVAQVWFAGSHADVGGGNADSGLSAITLEWMIMQAQIAGIMFDEAKIANVMQSANAFGAVHPPRAGLGRLFRHQTRDIAALSHAAGIAIPVVHESVAKRMSAGDYTPQNIPTNVAWVNS